MVQRHADGAGCRFSVGGNDFPERRVHRRLGGAVHVDQARQARVVAHPLGETHRFQRLTREDHRLEFELTALLLLHGVGRLQSIERRRRLTQDSDLFGGQQRVEILR
ncbi:hypothetical protein MAGR_19550 [Mycolicibacterium agri]|uniref:Uncharacterized protein n=1 Tax=Mycolicibacterium agri TaxID=36811 RepID=A0A7I9VYI5_MYCAG|nr:hypothetical protein MAGR_19550 [Mycolicibacterium agri]